MPSSRTASSVSSRLRHGLLHRCGPPSRRVKVSARRAAVACTSPKALHVVLLFGSRLTLIYEEGCGVGLIPTRRTDIDLLCTLWAHARMTILHRPPSSRSLTNRRPHFPLPARVPRFEATMEDAHRGEAGTPLASRDTYYMCALGDVGGSILEPTGSRLRRGAALGLRPRPADYPGMYPGATGTDATGSRRSGPSPASATSAVKSRDNQQLAE